MLLEEKLRQMMCLSFECTEMNEEVENIISKHHIGCVILFKQNFVDKEQSKRLIKSFKETALKSGNPSHIVAVDQKGVVQKNKLR